MILLASFDAQTPSLGRRLHAFSLQLHGWVSCFMGMGVVAVILIHVSVQLVSGFWGIGQNLVDEQGVHGQYL